MASQENIQKLFKFFSQNPQNLEQWLQNPATKTKEWGLEIDSNTLEITQTCLQHFSPPSYTTQQITQAHQYTISKLQETAHTQQWILYLMIGFYLLVFGMSSILLLVGLYQAISGQVGLGILLLVLGLAELTFIFATRPAHDLLVMIGNEAQLNLAIVGWLREMASWQHFTQKASLDDQKVAEQSMRDSTKWAMMLIEDYCSLQNNVATDKDTVTKYTQPNFFDLARTKFSERVKKLREQLAHRKAKAIVAPTAEISTQNAPQTQPTSASAPTPQTTASAPTPQTTTSASTPQPTSQSTPAPQPTSAPAPQLASTPATQSTPAPQSTSQSTPAPQ